MEPLGPSQSAFAEAPPELVAAIAWLATPANALSVGLAVALALALLTLLRRRRPAADERAAMARTVEGLAQGQERLAGALAQINETALRAQRETLHLVETRLDDVSQRFGQAVAGSAEKTAASLGELRQRLEAVDRAQENLEKLSQDVLGLQDILANKQARGAFGEIQLNDIVSAALPPDAYVFQPTLSNGRRPDALLRLPDPPGPIVVDAKFPLEAFEALRAAPSAAADPRAAQAAAERAFRTAVRAHIDAISERYVLSGETADGALMFVPSEAVYAELHGRFPKLVREGFAKRVWIVSPTTLMATLHTMRAILRDARLREEAGALRREIGRLANDVEKMLTGVNGLKSHFAQAQKHLSNLEVAAASTETRARRLEGDPTASAAEEPGAARAVAVAPSSAPSSAPGSLPEHGDAA